MNTFASVVSALADGQSVRRSVWEPITSLFIMDGTTVCQRGTAAPYSYDLSWCEIVAKDWQVIGAITAHSAL